MEVEFSLDDMMDLIQESIHFPHHQVSSRDLQQWSESVVRYLLHTFSSCSERRFELKQLLLYAQPEDIRNNKIVLTRPIDLMKSAYAKRERCKRKQSTELKTPEEVLGIHIEGEPCRFCHSTNTTHHAAQKRSLDEPTNYLYHCLSCGKRWKI